MEDTKTLLFASCDVGYYNRFGHSFVNSAIAFGHNVHIHMVNAEIGMDKIENPLVTYSFEENAPTTKEYYSINRFLIAPEILLTNDNTRMKLLILDIDCVVRAPIVLPDAAVGLYLREPFGANEWELRGTRVAAGAVMYDDTAWLFAQRVADKIRELPQYWFVDQVALAETYDEFSFAINVANLAEMNPPLMDWEFQDESMIWSAKGERKNSPVFKDEQKKFL